MGFQVRDAQDATVQGNTNDICCTRKQGIILPLGIPHHDPLCHCFSPSWWTTERRRETKRMGERSKEREFAHRPRLPPTCLCFHQRQPWLSWESLTDSSLYASLLCDSYHTTEASVPCSSSPSYSEGGKYIFPLLHTDKSSSLPICLEEKWKSP